MRSVARRLPPATDTEPDISGHLVRTRRTIISWCGCGTMFRRRASRARYPSTISLPGRSYWPNEPLAWN